MGFRDKNTFLRCSVLQCVAVACRVLQCIVAVYCSVLQCVAVRRSVLRIVDGPQKPIFFGVL